jgi:hypothetical protein
MEQAPSNSGIQSPGAGGNPALSKEAKTRSQRGKNFGPQLEPSAPDIAHPIKRRAYERQMGSIYGWFVETLERTENMDGEAAHAARGELQALLHKCISNLLRIALKSTRGDARRWAGELLASMRVSIEKHDRKLKANAAYAEMKKKLSGKSVTSALFPTYVCGIAQQELKTAERYRNRLLLHKPCAPALAAVKREIPKAYWRTMKLPEFSVKHEPTWWKFLKPLIWKKIDLSKMPPLKLREYDTLKVSMRKGGKPGSTRQR